MFKFIFLKFGYRLKQSGKTVRLIEQKLHVFFLGQRCLQSELDNFGQFSMRVRKRAANGNPEFYLNLNRFSAMKSFDSCSSKTVQWAKLFNLFRNCCSWFNYSLVRTVILLQTMVDPIHPSVHLHHFKLVSNQIGIESKFSIKNDYTAEGEDWLNNLNGLLCKLNFGAVAFHLYTAWNRCEITRKFPILAHLIAAHFGGFNAVFCISKKKKSSIQLLIPIVSWATPLQFNDNSNGFPSQFLFGLTATNFVRWIH